MLEPLGVAIHTINLAHIPHHGMSVAILGNGPIGLLSTADGARLAGARSVVAADPLPHRRAAAATFGADPVVDPGTGEAESLGVDVAFEIAGTNDGVRLAMDATRPGGRVVLAGIPDDDRTTFSASVARRKGLTIALVRRMNEAYPRAISMAARGQVDLGPVVTHHFPLSDVAGAFGAANRRAGLKVIVEPGRERPGP